MSLWNTASHHQGGTPRRGAHEDHATDEQERRAMNATSHNWFSRRGVLTGSGALFVSFSLAPAAIGQVAPNAPKPPSLPGSLNTARLLDAWIRVDADGGVTVLTGKAELGQGVHTALRQVAAEELRLDPLQIHLVGPDTDVTPNEGYTAGSQSITNSGVAIRNAAAQVREILIATAALKLGADPATLTA
jgi:nicotinate dehydrogenase subunit B